MTLCVFSGKNRWNSSKRMLDENIAIKCNTYRYVQYLIMSSFSYEISDE